MKHVEAIHGDGDFETSMDSGHEPPPELVQDILQSGCSMLTDYAGNKTAQLSLAHDMACRVVAGEVSLEDVLWGVG